jgi:predicted Holliday junction resolvase-like endonuclease
MDAPLLETINYASSQTDRWMFVALLVIGLAAVGILFKFFTARLDAIQQRMDEQTREFVDHLKDSNREMLTLISSSQDAINRNSQIMERVERKLGGR